MVVTLAGSPVAGAKNRASSYVLIVAAVVSVSNSSIDGSWSSPDTPCGNVRSTPPARFVFDLQEQHAISDWSLLDRADVSPRGPKPGLSNGMGWSRASRNACGRQSARR
jgi:hypothetical protein